MNGCITASSPSTPVSVAAGDSITFNVTVSPANINVQWYVDATPVSGATGKSFTYSPGEGDIGARTVMVKETSGCIFLEKHVWNVDVISDSSLIAYYPFNSNANDESGNGNNGTVYGATLTEDRFGNQNSAYSFDGIDDYIKTSASNLPTAERTVSLWFNVNTVSNQPGLLGYGGDSSGGNSWFMGLNLQSFKSYHMSGHWLVNRIDYYYDSEPIGEWHHWVITTDSSGTKMYVDGILEVSNSTYVNNTYVSEKELGIGVISSPNGFVPYTDANVGYCDGVLDEIRIYNRALSESEIQALYNSDY